MVYFKLDFFYFLSCFAATALPHEHAGELATNANGDMWPKPTPEDEEDAAATAWRDLVLQPPPLSDANGGACMPNAPNGDPAQALDDDDESAAPTAKPAKSVCCSWPCSAAKSW